MTQDIRWQQRFNNFELALADLKNDMQIVRTRPFSTLEAKGLIKTFEFTYELAWNCMKDIAINQGITDILGSKDAIRFAFKAGLIQDGELWMSMVDSRIKTAHTYHRELANNIAQRIVTYYYPEFLLFQKTLTALKNKK